MTSLTVVREAQVSDGRALYAAWSSLRQYNASLDSRIELAPVAEAEFVTDLEASLRRRNAATFVVERAGALIGFGTCGLEPNAPDRLPEQHLTVGYLYVDPSARRGGIGRRIFETMTLWATSQDSVSHVEMPVLASDSEAVAFWSALGFRPFIQRLWAPLSTGDRA